MEAVGVAKQNTLRLGFSLRWGVPEYITPGVNAYIYRDLPRPLRRRYVRDFSMLLRFLQNHMKPRGFGQAFARGWARQRPHPR